MRIVIWTGAAWETWGPDSLHTGLGGSETAAIHMATELAQRGHDVEIIGQVTPCQRDSVTYTDCQPYLLSSKLAQTSIIECDVFISSRCLPALHVLKPRTKLAVLWCHDIHVGDNHQNLLDKYDIVLCLSQWSKKILSSYYPEVPKNKFVVTRNGIDPRLFLREPKKEGCKVIYSSSPDRGLDQLLSYWPQIREMQPDAELHIYYGFNTWQQIANQHHDKDAKLQIQFFQDRLTSMQDCGVFAHGRVGQVELAKAFLESSMWLYPTAFKETSCISAMEAQAAGCLCIATRLAALAETVKYGLFVDPPSNSDVYRVKFLNHVKEFLKKPPCEIEFADLVDNAREWALRNLSWTQIAGQWEELFTKELKEVKS